MYFQLFFWLIEIFVAYLLADFLVGVFHWIKDTYFSPFTPIIGYNVIWPSRLHHVRPRNIIEASNLDLFISTGAWALIWMGPLFYYVGFSLFNVVLFLSIASYDIIHKYSHMIDSERPKWATFMQKIYIFQTHEEHHFHHTEPFSMNYCAITPFLNEPLEKIQFWRKLENIIEKTFGIKPRAKNYDFVEDVNYPAGIRFLP